MSVVIEVELPENLGRLQLPAAVSARLQHLLDRQDTGVPLTQIEREEAEGLVDLADLLALLRLRSSRPER